MHPQVIARRLVAGAGAGVEARPAIRLRADWLRLVAPRLGEHSGVILAEVGVDAQRLEALRREGVV
jgi:crotonobetainyl-CoA:carnitine CoA-transferase CaiB-like acyl-CoA transferase